MTLTNVSPEIQEMIDGIIDKTGLFNYVNVEIAAVPKAKELVKVSRANPWTEKLGKVSPCVTVLVYEEALERLSKEQQAMILEDAINNIGYDLEKDKVVIGAPKVTITLGGREKYGEKLIDAMECGHYAMVQIEEEKKQAKEQKTIKLK